MRAVAADSVHDDEVQEPTPVSTRQTFMRRRLLASAILLGLAFAPYPQPAAHAQCASPSLKVQGADESPALLHRGDQVTVTGRGFVDGCDDTGGGSAFGCSGEDGETEVPLDDIELVLVRQRPVLHQTALGVSDAGSAEDGQLGWVTWTFTVPNGHPLGRSSLVTEGSSRLPVRILR